VNLCSVSASQRRRLTLFPLTPANVMSPFTPKLAEVIVASHPISALAPLAILTSSGPGNRSTAGNDFAGPQGGSRI
jgi:hypothetical protein